jgi:hypothetical protein
MARRLILTGWWSGSDPAEVVEIGHDLATMTACLSRFRACDIAERERWRSWPEDDRPEPGQAGLPVVPGLMAWACDGADADPAGIAFG